MAPPNNPRVARVAMQVGRDTRHFINTFHASRSDAAILTLADLSNIANVFANWWNTTYRGAVQPNIFGIDCVVTKLDPALPFQVTVPLVGAGTYGTGNAEPGDVTAAVSWRTGLAGRKFRGRFYDFGVPSDAHTTADVMTGAYITELGTVAATLLADLTAAALAGVIFHRADNTATGITQVIVDQLLDSMRRRLAGRGD